MELIDKTIVGLTGGIASGKTTAVRAFEDCGWGVVDADEVSRKLTVSGAPLERKMAELFPNALSNGFIDRSKLRKIVFESKSELKKLNSLTQSEIKKAVESELRSAPQSMVLLVVPLMFESGFDELCDRIITLSCPREVRAVRIKKRDGISIELAEKMIDAQMTDGEREKFSDYIISSDCKEEEFVSRVNALASELTLALKK